VDWIQVVENVIKERDVVDTILNIPNFIKHGQSRYWFVNKYATKRN